MEFMQPIIQYFDDASWLANLLGIGSALVAIVGIFHRFIKPFLFEARIDKLIPSDFEIKWNGALEKKVAKIAIVDDQPADFPTAELKADGYHVQTYKQVTLAITGQLANYDIVFLDMKGVVKDDPESGGLKLIAELRRLNPIQKICAVSSKTFDINATEFFRQADDAKKKPLTAIECSAVINSFLEELFSVKTLRASALQAMNQLARNQRTKVVSHIRSFSTGAMNGDQLRERMSNTIGDAALSYRLVNIARAIAHVS